MRVKITTDFGEMIFDMAQGDAMLLIDQAITAAKGKSIAAEVIKGTETKPGCIEFDLTEMEARPVKVEGIKPEAATPADAPAQREVPRSRAETMFGDRSGWNMPAAGHGNAARPDGQEAYRGFLFIRCEECGEVKAYNSKFPATYFHCNCGHRTALRGLRAAHVRCNKCGGEFNYRTNMQTDFTIDCLACGSPVDMELGTKGTAFVPVGQKFSGGTRKW